MVKHSARRCDDHGDTSEHLVKSVVDQAHLSPLPLLFRPVLWQYDHALWLFPSPHLLVLADKAAPFDWTYNGCQTFNPSSFGRDQSFSVYFPATKTVQQSSC
mmetsp:Transcript_1447/g.4347  ORF Transcript_1447/g.4347 Transcript_1447/m.4347 type:complete len:102 (+) Transcript_1447:522-827(+)